MRGSKDISPKEILIFSYWSTILKLLKVGIAWESIMTFTEEEINIVIGIEMAVQQKEQDDQAKEMAKSNFGSMRRF